jgi:hypothetical protein
VVEESNLPWLHALLELLKLEIMERNEQNLELSASKAGNSCCLLHVGFLLALFVDSQDGGTMFLQNLG